MNKLTPDQLILLNRKVVADNTIITPGTIDTVKKIAEIPYEKNEELFYKYKGTIEKAAKLGSLIVKQKPFEKANQETAVLALLTLLEINGYKLINYKNDIEELSSCLYETDLENICKWINSHIEDEGYINPN